MSGVALAGGLAGCGGSGSADTPAETQGNLVEMTDDLVFEPAELTVSVGETITWDVPLVAEEFAPCPNYRIATAPLDLESVVFLTETGTVIEDIAGIESMLLAGRHCAVLFLEHPQATALRDRLADTPVTLAETGRRVTGINFSNGRRVDLGVYVVE